jgi:hypothetical protein
MWLILKNVKLLLNQWQKRYKMIFIQNRKLKKQWKTQQWGYIGKIYLQRELI